LDVIFLFTNISIDSALDNISKRRCFISEECNISKDEFLKAISLVLNSSYFTFDNYIYKQTFRTPMVSPSSPKVADLVLRDLEERALKKIGIQPFYFKICFYFRYVDNIALAISSHLTTNVLNVFNSFHHRLHFTIELGGEVLNCLNVTIKISITLYNLIDSINRSFQGDI